MNFVLEKPILLKCFLNKLKESENVVKENFYISDYKIKRVITDTRSFNKSGGIFFAIKGKNFNGHGFVREIIEKVDFVVVSEEVDVREKDFQKIIFVKDTTIALDVLANIYRNLFPELKVIAVVGSNGKTTTKELIKSILKSQYNVCATEKNLNNLLGVAYTLFQLNSHNKFCVLEMGISVKNEMGILSSTAQPDTVVFTNIGKEHLEFLGSVEEVFREEIEAMKYVKNGGFVVLNRDDSYLRRILNGKPKKWYGINSHEVDVFAKDISYLGEGMSAKVVIRTLLGTSLSFDLETCLYGKHNVYNILAAIAVCFYNGMDNVEAMKKVIKDFSSVEMRGKRYKVGENVIVDESYNANPDSMKVVMKEFLEMFNEKKKIMVLGDMLELGDYSEYEHRHLLDEIELEKIEKVFLVGKEMKFLKEKYSNSEKIVYFEDIVKLREELKRRLNEGQGLSVLFKASRGIGLDIVVKDLVENKD